jgi:all-trans-8'-apo-beta-carotenal 15,15'-oxygenase
MNRLVEYFELNACVEEEFQNEYLKFDRPVPADINGTVFRNGNGRFVHQNTRYDHIFDGDGMITSFSFSNGRVNYQNKYVRTQELDQEEQAQKMLYRSFGTNIPGGLLANLFKTKFKNASNTSVIWHAGKLLSLWEGGLPHEIDPTSLETISRYDYAGKLQNSFSWLDRMIFPELAFSAHPKIHPTTGELYNFGTVPGLQQRLVEYKISPQGEVDTIEAIKMPGMVFTHDFVLTSSGKRVYFFTPVKFQLLPLFLGLQSPVSSIKVQPHLPVDILVVDENNQQTHFQTDFGFIFHFANGFDLDEDRLIVDGFMMPNFPGAEVNKKLFTGDDTATPAGVLTRFELHLKSKTVQRKTLSQLPAELPSINRQHTGLDYQYVWSLACPPEADYKLLDAIQKVDVQSSKVTYKSLFPDIPGEPLFVPKQNAQQEDDGYLVTLVFHPTEGKTYLHIFDAATLEEISKAPLPHNIPLGFHGIFVEQHP